MKSNENTQVVTCPPCGENVALATKRGFLNEETFFTTPLLACGVLPTQGWQWKRHCALSTSRARETTVVSFSMKGKVAEGRMRGKVNGFTLIELLVVVLIIGILAAVAVPQYQKSVEKSRMAGAISLVKSVGDAQKIYYLANGTYTTNFEDLDIELSLNKPAKDSAVGTYTHVELYRAKADSMIYAQPLGNNQLLWGIYYNMDTGKMYCGANQNDTKALSLCQQYGNGEFTRCYSQSWAVRCFEMN